MDKNYGCNKQIVTFPSVGLLSVFGVSDEKPFDKYNDRYHTLSFGCQDITRTADYATENGYKVSEFTVVDGETLDELEADKGTQIATELLDVFNKYGENELYFALRDDYSDYLIDGVKMVSVSTDDTIELYRHGFVKVSSVSDAEKLFRNAWTKLRLC